MGNGEDCIFRLTWTTEQVVMLLKKEMDFKVKRLNSILNKEFHIKHKK